MNTPLDNSIQKMSGPGLLGLAGLLLISLLLLTGCESPSGTPGTRPGGGALGRPGTQAPGNPRKTSTPGSLQSQKPATSLGGQSSAPTGTASKNETNPQNPLISAKPDDEKKPDGSPLEALNPLGPTVKIEQAGNTVELASMIIAAKANPFLDWLPKPLVPVESSEIPGAVVPAGAPVDPFATVNLLGVIYNAKTTVALISVGGNQTQFAKKGSLLDLETGQAKVIDLRPDGVDLQLLDDTSQKRTFTLPDIIGYDPAGATANAAANASTPEAPPSGKSKSGRPSPTEGADLPALGKLKRLMEHSQASSAKSSAKGAQVDLQEP